VNLARAHLQLETEVKLQDIPSALSIVVDQIALASSSIAG